MKASIGIKVQGLVVAALLIVGAAVCAASYVIFDRGFTSYARGEIVLSQGIVEALLAELGQSSAGASAFIASRPDIVAGVREGDTAGVRAIAADALGRLGLGLVTVADARGTVVGRGHSDKAGDSVIGQRNVAEALAGRATVGVEEGTVVKFSLRSGAPIYDGDRIIGSVTTGFDLATDGFVDMVKRKCGVECTVFLGDTREASTLLLEGGERAVGTKLDNRAVLDAVLGRSEVYFGRNRIFGRTYDTAYWPVLDRDGKAVGMYFIGKDVDVIERELASMLRVTALVTALIAAVIVAASAFFVRGITTPLRHATAMLKDISEGSGDLTKRLEVRTRDEIATMATYFNLTIGKVRELVSEIERQASALSGIGVELSSSMTETAASVNEISSNIQSIRKQTVNQSASVVETNSTMGQIKLTIERLDGYIASQSESVLQSSSAIEEMIANVASVARTLAQNATNIDDLAQASGQGRADVVKVSEEIGQIARDSQGLIEISAMIDNLASQTNLLSMNAAIEAAHAGASGKGFAVVAGEIRKLAESSSSQAKTIANVLGAMKSSIDRITAASDVVRRQFEGIDSKVRLVAEREDGIRRAMEEQGAGSNEILSIVGQLNDLTSMVKAGSAEMLTGSEEVAVESRNLGIITEEVSGSMNEMAAGVEEITTAIHMVNQVAQANKESIEALMAMVRQFKTA